MKKSFFLLPIAALAAIFSFSACSSGDDGPTFNPSSSSTVDDIPIQLACDWEQIPPSTGGFCMEAGGLSNRELRDFRDLCAEDDENLGVGTITDKCPNNPDLPCVYSEDGQKINVYLYGNMARAAQYMYGGCPDMSEFL